MSLDDYTPNENNGDSLKPSEIIDHLLIVRVRQRKDGIVTQYSPEGGPGVVVDVVDLADGAVYSDVLWMNGALVDNLTPNVGKTVAIKLVWVAGKNGRNYVGIQAADEAEKTRAATFLTTNPDPWQQLADVAPATATPAAPAVPTPAAVAAAAPQAAPAIAIPENLSAEQLEQLKAMGVQVPA